MPNTQIEIVDLQEAPDAAFGVVRREHELRVHTPQPGETVYTALGEYAIWPAIEAGEAQFVPGEQWATLEHNDNSPTVYQWANAEALRTQASQGSFSPNHMNVLDDALFRKQRATAAGDRLVIAHEDAFRTTLENHGVPIASWSDSKIHDLFNYTRSNTPLRHGAEVDNMTLYRVRDTLWLSTAQTMLNVYHQDAHGERYKLKEAEKTVIDVNGVEKTVIPTMRSSLGETAYLRDGVPEDTWHTARRCLREELGIEDDTTITRMVATGSLLRLKTHARQQFFPIASEDRTHYYDVELKDVRPSYINEEYDPDGRLRARILFKWCKVID